MRQLLVLATVTLVVGVIAAGLFFRLVAASAPEAAPLVDVVGPSSTILTGVFYTLILAALFVPAELLIQRAARRLALSTVDRTDDVPAWLAKHGLEPSLPGLLMRVVTILGPLLAGMLQNLAQVK